ncbi:hypothetical protein BN903_7 [Halorubrum sp. AJ67]|nr:hypothetical protein BN903_7 [Halorubrum sp. AJ67]
MDATTIGKLQHQIDSPTRRTTDGEHSCTEGETSTRTVIRAE